MTMVYCRGCAKQIHESAPTCPSCGAVQGIVPPPGAAATPGAPRSGIKLVGWALVWAAVFWVGSLFLLGAIVGALNPENAEKAGAQAGEAMSGLLMLLALCLSVVLTVFGKLPGTRKN